MRGTSNLAAFVGSSASVRSRGLWAAMAGARIALLSAFLLSSGAACRMPVGLNHVAGVAPHCEGQLCVEVVNFQSHQPHVGMWIEAPPATNLVNARVAAERRLLVRASTRSRGSRSIATYIGGAGRHRRGHGLVLEFPLNTRLSHSGYWGEMFLDIQLDVPGRPAACARSSPGLTGSRSGAVNERRMATLSTTGGAGAGHGPPRCITVQYQARRAAGDPSTPAAQSERITVLDWGKPAKPTRQRDQSGCPTSPGRPGEGSRADGVERTVLLSVRIQAGPRADIRGMTWSPASAPRCAGGHPALGHYPRRGGAQPRPRRRAGALGASGRPERRARRPGRFDEDRPLFDQTSVVDLLMVERAGAPDAREICVRVPVTGPGVIYWDQKRWSLGDGSPSDTRWRFSRQPAP